MRPRILSRKCVYRSPWIDLYLDDVKFPGGRIIRKHHRLCFRKEGVTAVVEDSRGRILMIRSYRYPLNSLEWEIPAGACEKGESVTATAKREVLEETGYRTKGHKRVSSFHPISGIGNLLFHVVRCRAGEKCGEHDPNEVSEVKWFSKKEVCRMIRRGKIRDGFSLAALLLVFFNVTGRTGDFSWGHRN